MKTLLKRLIAWPFTWAFYVLGDAVSKPMQWAEWLGRLYPAYNWLMRRSVSIQDWADMKDPWGPWGDVKETQ